MEVLYILSGRSCGVRDKDVTAHVGMEEGCGDVICKGGVVT